MTLWPYIAGAYAVGLIVPVAFAVQAALRLGAARRRLAALEPERASR